MRTQYKIVFVVYISAYHKHRTSTKIEEVWIMIFEYISATMSRINVTRNVCACVCFQVRWSRYVLYKNVGWNSCDIPGWLLIIVAMDTMSFVNTKHVYVFFISYATVVFYLTNTDTIESTPNSIVDQHRPDDGNLPE